MLAAVSPGFILVFFFSEVSYQLHPVWISSLESILHEVPKAEGAYMENVIDDHLSLSIGSLNYELLWKAFKWALHVVGDDCLKTSGSCLKCTMAGFEKFLGSKSQDSNICNSFLAEEL